MLYDQQVRGWGSAISDAEQPKHELYRDVAEKLRELARLIGAEAGAASTSYNSKEIKGVCL